MSDTPNYSDYLKLDRLLALQGGLNDDETSVSSDELHFIVVHQVYELWFKLILRELRLGRDALGQPRVAEEMIPVVVHHLRRVNEILALGADQFRVMETLAAQDFLDFRDKLVPSSGFQSFQMREIETLLGLDDAQRVPVGGVDVLAHLRHAAQRSAAGAAALARIERTRAETSLRDALHAWLYRTPIQGSMPADPNDETNVQHFLSEYVDRLIAANARQAEHLMTVGVGAPESIRQRFQADAARARAFLFADDVSEADKRRVRRIRAGILFIESYRDLPLVAWPRLLLDTVLEMEELLVLWRTRHARMVERMVGRRVGTGGSSGVEYLDQTANYRIFVELWSVRTLLLPRRELPRLQRPEQYGFADAGGKGDG